jgi:hypothetical protein
MIRPADSLARAARLVEDDAWRKRVGWTEDQILETQKIDGVASLDSAPIMLLCEIGPL